MSSFIEKITSHGIDTEIALSRFAGDQELYEKCFYMLLEEPNFEALGQHLAAADYDSAFKAAHSLKGIVGNLELTGLYKSVSIITESLRTGDHQVLDAQYQAVLNELEALKQAVK